MVRTVVLFAASLVAVAAESPGAFDGRWDISVPNDTRVRAWWLEVTGAGTPALAGRFVGAPGGQMDVIPKISINNGELEFVFDRNYGNPRSGNGQRGVYRARLVNGKLVGTFTVEGQPGRTLDWNGVRAPEIAEQDDGSWKPAKPVDLFNRKDLS